MYVFIYNFIYKQNNHQNDHQKRNAEVCAWEAVGYDLSSQWDDILIPRWKHSRNPSQWRMISLFFKIKHYMVRESKQYSKFFSEK